MSSLVAAATSLLPLHISTPCDPALEALLSRLPVAAYVCDAAGHITFFNEPATIVWGRRPRLNDAGDRYCGSFRLFSPQGRLIAHDACWMARALRERCAYNDCEIVIERPDGSRRFALAFANPLHDREGRLVGAVNVLIDITARHDDEEAWRIASENKDRFLAVLSHELRSPLAPIRSAVELLRRIGGTDRLADEAVDVIDRQVMLLTRLIDDLMDLSRISRDRLVLKLAPTDLRTAIRAAIETVQPLIKRKRHALTVDLPEHPLMLHGDAARLTQAIGNVLNNAVKFTPPNGNIAVEARIARDRIEVCVRDDGVGVAPADAVHAFDMFGQADAGTGERSGLGIGLALVKRLIEMHGGTAALDSAGSGHGTRVTLSLPLAERPHLLRPELELSTRVICRPLRLLVVDDDCDAAHWLAALLQHDGHTVECATDGGSVLRLPATFAPDAALIDIDMPGLSGLQLARELRARFGSACMLIAVTGYGQVADRQRSAQAGFEHHLVKPVDAHTLSVLLAARAQDRGRDEPPTVH